MNDKAERVIEAARVVCQWLDYHSEVVAEMDEEARKEIAGMHDAVVDYEESELNLEY